MRNRHARVKGVLEKQANTGLDSGGARSNPNIWSLFLGNDAFHLFSE